MTFSNLIFTENKNEKKKKIVGRDLFLAFEFWLRYSSIVIKVVLLPTYQ